MRHRALPIVLAVLFTPLLLTDAEGSRPVDVFKKLDGTWTGFFVGYNEKGEELYRIEVEQVYETVSDTTQTVRIRDKDLKTGKVVTGEGRNVAQVGTDGRLQLRCLVKKSNGESVAHDGRIVRGADGETQLIWYSNNPDRSETFREAVQTVGSNDIYTIDGMGRYGKSLILMHGRYIRQKLKPVDR